MCKMARFALKFKEINKREINVVRFLKNSKKSMKRKTLGKIENEKEINEH